MIVFSYPSGDNLEALLSNAEGSAAYAQVREYLIDIIEEGGEVDIAVAFSHDTLLTRRFFGDGYEFSYPMPLLDRADLDGALCALEEYCRRHELPLVYCDLLREECNALVARYRFSREECFDLSEEGEDEELIYRLTVKNECSLFEEIPTLSDGTLTLSALTEQDIPSYALLCRDEEILALWGYDYRDSTPELSDEDFYLMAKEELASGISMTFAVRAGGRFVGEAVLYAFDGKGGAEFSIRILKGYRCMGYAHRALCLLLDFCENDLALRHLDGVCLKENTPSRALMGGLMHFLGERDGETVLYRKELI